jgi:hypothetical protein
MKNLTRSSSGSDAATRILRQTIAVPDVSRVTTPIISDRCRCCHDLFFVVAAADVIAAVDGSPIESRRNSRLQWLTPST